VAAERILVLDEIDSTNAQARRMAEAGERGPLWITARRQTAGRGRRGRSWETGEGNLAATWLGVTDRRPSEAAKVSFVAALAVIDLARELAPAARASLKWPNDLLIDGAKAAGILVESGSASAGGLWVAVGVGVNLIAAPEIPGRPTTTLAAHRSAPPPRALDALDALAGHFDRWFEVWDRVGFEAIVNAWTERAEGIGRACVARLAEETVSGVAEGLDPDGALRLRTTDGGVRRITAGDVFF
jgi:BirA family transcriptional regulator, biotin operon repressor / biotin---[acetyl-CoA-carboxylase] ligase